MYDQTTGKCWYRYDEDYVLEPRHTATAVTTSYTVDMNWHADSRAIDHIMSELDKLAIQDKYNGTEKVHMVSGSGMEISHTGKSFIHTLSHKLKLCNILHVPKATKNILYIHCFALDNNIFFEIHPWFFQLRISTRRALYDGLYPITAAPHFAKFSFGVNKSSLIGWHECLGHHAL
jgi:hypothetical protein